MPGTLAGVSTTLTSASWSLVQWPSGVHGYLVSDAAKASFWASLLRCSLCLSVSKPPGAKVYQQERFSSNPQPEVIFLAMTCTMQSQPGLLWATGVLRRNVAMRSSLGILGVLSYPVFCQLLIQ